MRGAWETNLLGEYGLVLGEERRVLGITWVSCMYEVLREVIELRRFIGHVTRMSGGGLVELGVCLGEKNEAQGTQYLLIAIGARILHVTCFAFFNIGNFHPVFGPFPNIPDSFISGKTILDEIVRNGSNRNRLPSLRRQSHIFSFRWLIDQIYIVLFLRRSSLLRQRSERVFVL